MKDSSLKMARLAPEFDVTAAIRADAETGNRPVVDSSVAPFPLQVEHPDGLEGGGHADRPTVRIMSMTWIPSCGGTACGGERPPEYGRPFLTIDEAARLLGVSRKRLANMVADEKARLGRLPDFVCDAGGRMARRILRDELLEWAKGMARKRGRPPKRTA